MTSRLTAVTRRRLLVALLPLVAVAVAACGSDTSSGARTVEIKLKPEGCDPFAVTVPTGKTTFHAVNDGASAISEFEVLDGTKILGEKESLTPGLDGTFTIDLQPGSFTLACPGGSQHATGTLTVTAAGGSAPANSSGAGTAESTGCVPSENDRPVTAHLAAKLSDFTIELAASQIAAGTISIDGTNAGTHPHEIVAVRGVTKDALPFDAAGKVDEDRLPGGAAVGELEAFAPGRQCSASLTLTPGTYTLFCNVADDAGAHVKLGMVTTLTVT